jgi:molybdate transport system substrate-binding protein
VSQLELTVFSTAAMKTVFDELAPLFERETGTSLNLRFGPSLQLEKRLGEGEAADVAIVSENGARDLARQGMLADGSITAIARSSIGIAVQKGAPKPDISTVDGFKRAMLAAKSIACSKPVGGGQSGVHIARVFADLGIAEQMAAKSRYGEGGAKGLAGLVLKRGEADIGIQQMAELMAVDGIDVVGPLPAEIQMITPFVAAIPAKAAHAKAARALIGLLLTPAAKRVIRSKGLEPA